MFAFKDKKDDDGPRLITKQQLQDAYTRAGVAALETMVHTLVEVAEFHATAIEKPGVLLAAKIVRDVAKHLESDTSHMWTLPSTGRAPK